MKQMNKKNLDLFDLIYPYNISLDKIRVGRDKDGGYIVPKNIIVDTLLSYGIGDDISFEIDFINIFHKPVYGFDKKLILNYDNPMLSLIEQPITESCGIKEHIIQLALEGKHLAVKMDIEHDEWDVLNNTLFDNIAYIVVEFHGLLTKPQRYKHMRKVLKNLNEYFVCAHVHGNNYGEIIYSEELFFPDVLEVLYVSKNHINLNSNIEKESTLFPTSLDRPNNPNNPDIPCHWWCLPSSIKEN